MTHTDKPFAGDLNPSYEPRVGDVVLVEARIEQIKSNRLIVNLLNGAEVWQSDTSRAIEIRAPLKSRVTKRPLRTGDKVRYNATEGVNEGYYHGRLVAYDNGKWIIRDNTSSHTGGKLIERTEEDIHFGYGYD